MNDTPHVPKDWQHGVFILGESAYPDDRWPGEMILATNWVPAYIAGRVTDGTYTKIANAIGPTRAGFWNSHSFANLIVLPEGAHSKVRPSTQQYREAIAWLNETMVQLRPTSVWIWGIDQSQYSAPVLDRLGIPYEVAKHPTSYGITHAYLRESWCRLMAKAT